MKAFNHLLRLMEYKHITILRSEYEGVCSANHYPLDTLTGFNSRGMWVKKGARSRFRNELGVPLFTSDQIYSPVLGSRSVAAEINCPYQDV